MNETWKSVVKMLPAGATILGTALGGPIGAIAGGVGSLLAHALGADEATPDAVAAAIQADPAAAEKILELQMSTQVSLQQMAANQTVALAQEETKQQGAAYADVANARDRDVKIIQVAGHNWRADILAYLATIGFMGSIVALTFFPLPQSTHDAVLLLLGALISVVKDVFGFEFGASQQDKTGDQKEALKQLADTQPPASPPGTPITETTR